jgi:hypothetical protein
MRIETVHVRLGISAAVELSQTICKTPILQPELIAADENPIITGPE